MAGDFYTLLSCEQCRIKRLDFVHCNQLIYIDPTFENDSTLIMSGTQKNKKKSSQIQLLKGKLDISRSGMGFVIVENQERDILIKPNKKSNYEFIQKEKYSSDFKNC